MNNLASRIDATQLHMVSRDEVASTAHALLAGGNKEKGPLLAASTAVLFAVMAERCGMDAHDLYLLGRKILFDPAPHHFKPNVQMEALRDFAGMRLRDRPTI